MNLLPRPQTLNIREGCLVSKTLCVKDLCNDYRIARALECFEHSDNGVKLTVSYNNNGSEGYTLDISEKIITICGESLQGAFYGIQTLRQIFENPVVPCLHIEDRPDMSYRGFYHDVTRGKVPTVETLKKLIDTLAYYKMNSLQIYVEHTFPFKEFGDEIERFGYLTAEEIKELDDYCYDNFIEFIPSIATFGHLYELLQREEYRELQAIENYEAKNVFWIERMGHHTIDPLNPRSFEVIKSLIDQYMPLFRTDKFNICCDETFDLKSGKHKGKDTGKLYIDFVKKIIDYLKSKGKTVMMWGDIVLQHPETIQYLPEDTVLLNWHYSPTPTEKSFIIFENSGYTQIVCPGTGTWNRLVECVDDSGQNICRMLDFGYSHGAAGMLNTNWGDWGNPCSLELAMHGLVLGAAKSWYKATEVNCEFVDSINALQYKKENAAEYVSMLNEANKMVSWRPLVKAYSNRAFNSSYEIDYPDKETVKSAIGICKKVSDTLVRQVWEKDEYRREMLSCAEGIIVIAELLSKLAGYKIDRISDTSHWLSDFRKNWLLSNKESELSEIEKMFNFMEHIEV